MEPVDGGFRARVQMDPGGSRRQIRGPRRPQRDLESMRAIFIAHGEAFQEKYVSQPFQNIEIYNLMCKILNLTPAENDGDFEKIKHVLK